jgi:RecB family exonuclease
VHRAIEHYLRAKMAGVTLAADDVTGEWDAIWDEAAEGAEFKSDEDVEALKASGAKLAEKYLREAAPAITPVAVEMPVAGEIAGVAVRGIVDIIDASGRIIDVKTSSRKPSKVTGDHSFQLATYTALLGDSASGAARIDALVATKDPQLVQIEHTPGADGQKLVETMYPLVAEGISSGLFLPNRSSLLCGYCAYRTECADEYGGAVE